MGSPHQSPARPAGNPPLISIILCTRNGAPKLRETLRSFEALETPSEADAEVLVVDNGSTDDTAEVVRAAQQRSPRVRSLYVATKGKAHALNAALECAPGEVLLFTDDDVLATPDWMVRMATPLLARRCEAVTGRVTLAPGLERPWMTLSHAWWLAAPPDNEDRELVGANMAFHRRVLERVPRFDTELGPGALGFGEDKLFGFQLAEARFRIEYLREARVIHNVDASRLRREVWLGDAVKRGHVDAYHAYHWEHVGLRAPLLRAFWFALKLALRRRARGPLPTDVEGCELWEMHYLRRLEEARHFRRERRRPRNYARRGLTKRLLPG